jgi:hypothetical protein
VLINPSEVTATKSLRIALPENIDAAVDYNPEEDE